MSKTFRPYDPDQPLLLPAALTIDCKQSVKDN